MMENTRPRIGVTCLQMLLALGFTLIILSRFLSPAPHFDEFYHVLAAQSLVENGTLTVNESGDGYTRAKAFTYAVAACYRWLGESWASARLPSLIAAAFLVAAIFGFLHRTVSTRAAWFGAGLFMLAPDVITHASMVRFYMPHSLFVWLAAVSAYVFVTGSFALKSRLAVLIFGLGCAAMAAHLQTTTAIAALIAALWAGTEFARWLVRCERQQFRWAIVWTLLVLVIAVPAVWFGFQYTGAWEHILIKFQTPRIWSEGSRDQYQYYYRFFANNYPLLWAGFPFMAVIALATRPRPAWFCLAFFGLAFAIHSVMPFKAVRYLAYAWPFFFALWAIGLDGLLVWLVAQGRNIIAHLFSEKLANQAWAGGLVGLVLLVGLLNAAWMTPEFKLARHMLTGESLGPSDRQRWDRASTILKPIAQETGFVVSAAPPKARYYLGRLDVCLSVTQAQHRPDFEHDRIMGRPVITTPQSVQRLLDEHPSGLIVVDTVQFGSSVFVPRDTALFIETHTQPIELPLEWGVRAFRWDPKAPPVSGQ